MQVSGKESDPWHVAVSVRSSGRAEIVTAERQELPLARACTLIGLSRSWCYQRQRRAHPDDTSLQDEIERIVLDCPAYSYRRVAAAGCEPDCDGAGSRALSAQNSPALARSAACWRLNSAVLSAQ
jgi:hypothetical protein